MKKYIAFTFCLIILTACAGNPPAWWNPSGRYSTPSPTSSTVSTPTAIPTISTPAPEEETLLPTVDSDYEEMVLSPVMAQEDTPSSTNLSPSILEE